MMEHTPPPDSEVNEVPERIKHIYDSLQAEARVHVHERAHLRS